MTYRGNSRRNFLKTLTTTALVAPSSLTVFAGISDRQDEGGFSENPNPEITQDVPLIYSDGPSSPLFEPLDIPGNLELSKIDSSMVSGQMVEAAKSAPIGKSVAWGIPFNIGGQIIYIKDKSYTISINPRSGNWIIFMHTSDRRICPGIPMVFMRSH